MSPSSPNPPAWAAPRATRPQATANATSTLPFGLRGSLPLATVGTSAVFGAMSGASAATVATVGQLMLPPLKERGYPDDFRAVVRQVLRNGRPNAHPGEVGDPHTGERLLKLFRHLKSPSSA